VETGIVPGLTIAGVVNEVPFHLENLHWLEEFPQTIIGAPIASVTIRGCRFPSEEVATFTKDDHVMD
jgi:hypothetical protein